jgi:uncharacterized OB-fold protein
MSEVKPRIIEQELRLPYRWSAGVAGTKFLEGLKNGKILGTRCPKCRRVLVPVRRFCPRCFVDTTELVEVRDEGTLRTFTIINYRYTGQPKDPPYIVGVIKLDGADVGFTHFIGGVDLSDIERAGRELKVGTRVRAVWKPKEKREGSIFDIEYFEPVKG